MQISKTTFHVPYQQGINDTHSDCVHRPRPESATTVITVTCDSTRATVPDAVGCCGVCVRLGSLSCASPNETQYAPATGGPVVDPDRKSEDGDPEFG